MDSAVEAAWGWHGPAVGAAWGQRGAGVGAAFGSSLGAVYWWCWGGMQLLAWRGNCVGVVLQQCGGSVGAICGLCESGVQRRAAAWERCEVSS